MKVKRERKKREKGEMLFVNYFDQIKLAIRKIYCIVIIIIISECLNCNYNNIRMFVFKYKLYKLN